MNKLNPSDLLGARTYFTGFDNKSYISSNKNEKSKILKRTLKVLLLTKNKIVFGASHLKNDLALDLIQEAPAIFEKGLVTPALRNEYNGDLSKAINNPALDISIFPSYVGWDLTDNTTWFTERLYDGFKFDNSLLRNNIKNTSNKNINKIIKILENPKYFDRDLSNKKIIELLNPNDIQSFNKYQNLIYNVSGARVVNCESSLDQENMIFDYSLTNIEDKKIFLSDVEIFHRIFIEQTLNTLHRNNAMFNISFIDALDFNDILDLREKIDSTNFINKYDSLINKSNELIEKKDFIDFYSIEELMSISENLHINFNKNIEQEANKYLKSKRHYQEDKAIWEPIYNIIKSLNPLTSTIDTTKNLIYLTRNVYNQITTKKEENNYKQFLTEQAKVAKNLIKNTQVDNGTSLIETLKLIQDYSYNKYSNF